jgi:hypothetical protein
MQLSSRSILFAACFITVGILNLTCLLHICNDDFFDKDKYFDTN